MIQSKYGLGNMRKNLLFCAIFLVACFLRLYQLGNVPYGVINDEASYIYSSYSVWKTAKGIDGTFLPVSFNTDSSNSPVPIYVSAPFVGLLGVSPFSGRLPYALAGIGTVVLIYFISKKLFANDWISLSAMFVLALSPWHLHVSRAAFDGTMALFFYALGIWIFLRYKDTQKLLWSLIPFFLGFYSYHAMKFFFIFFLPFLMFVYLRNIKKRKKEFFLFGVGYIIILLSFVAVSFFGHVTRQETTLLSLSDTNTIRLVNYERSTSSAPGFLISLFNNKFMTTARVIRENFLEPFSPQYLFLYGDTNSSGATLGLFFRGAMYIIELPLLLLGIYFLFHSQNKKVKAFLIGGLICAAFPSTFVSGKTFAIRDLMMLPFLSLLTGMGIYSAALLVKEKVFWQRTVLGVAVGVWYIFLICSYLYQYYYRYPQYGAEAWMRDRRDIANVIYESTQKYDHIFVASPEKIFLAQYGIVAQVDPKLIQSAWEKNTVVGKIQFGYQCLQDKDGKFTEKLPPHSLYIAPANCNANVSPQREIYNVTVPTEVLWKIYEI